MKCKSCGSKIKKNFNVCPNCGKKIIVKEKSKNINKKFFTISSIFLIIIILFICILSFFYSDIEKVKNSVVMLEVYNSRNELMATGSGFCAYKKNHIVTNFHVIEDAYSVKVVTDDKKKIESSGVLFFDREADLAVITIDGELKPLKIGNSSDLKVKSKVTAIGSPMGELNTISEGIISNIEEKDFIRISVLISHGSSGGVLLDNRNEVIGITSAGYDEAQNLNFAIPVNVLNKLYKENKDNKSKKFTELYNYINGDWEIVTDEDCTFHRVNDGVKKVRINAESAGGVGDIFSKTTSNPAYKIFDNKIGDVLDINYKLAGDENIYECNETWYSVTLDDGTEGFIWGGYQSMYVQEIR